MKILLVVHYFFPHVGGMEAVVEKQAKSLVDLGNEVTILTCSPQKDLPLSEQRDGYSIKRLPAVNSLEKRFGIPFPLISPLRAFSILREVTAHDIVHIHDVFYISSHLAALACLVKRKPFFLTQHVAIVDHPSMLIRLMQHAVYKTFGKLIFKKAKNIICYNQTVRNFLRTQGVPNQKIFTQYNGIDTNYFQPASPQQKRALRRQYALPTDKPIALFVGRLVPKKGFDIVFDAQSDNYFTLIVGEGVTPAHITSNENVELFGPATQEQLRDLYQLSDAFIFPAIGEIFTLVMQEAMASGLPVVTTKDPGYDNYNFSRQHIQLVPRDKHNLQHALLRLFDDAKQQHEASEYARTFATEYFNWEQNYPREYALYRSLKT